MKARHGFIYLLFFVLAATVAVLGPERSHSEAPAHVSEVPPKALAALREGRYLRASLILRDYLATGADTSAATLLLAARAEAGWGDWQRVHELLAGRSWLDGVASGYGWSLLGRSQLALGRTREGAASLARYLEAADDAPATGHEPGIALLRRADALVEDGRPAEAVAAYDEAATLLPAIADWIEVFAASAAARGGDTAAVRARLARADASLRADWSWRTMIRARREAGDLAGAQAAAEAAAAEVSTDARRAAAWSVIGSIRAERGNTAGARAAWIRAMNLAPGSGAALEAARAMSERGGLTPADRLIIGRIYLRHGNLDRAVAGIEAYLAAGLGTAAEREQLRYDIANAHFRGGDYAAAERALVDVARSTSDRRVAGDALYTVARAQYRLSRADAAKATLQRIIAEYADQPAAVRAAYLTADLDHDALKLDRATDYYRQAVRLDPVSTQAGIARMRLGGISWAAGRYDEALREFEDYRTTHRTGSAHQQATFWSAMALQKLGREDEARARFRQTFHLDPFGYYGGLAADQLGEDPLASRIEPSPPSSTTQAAQVARALARIDLLREIGWNEAASFEMDRVRRVLATYDGALYALAESLNERGLTSAGIGLGWEIYRREGAWNPRLLRIVYPFPFRQIIVAEAKERGVDPFLAAALIRQESMFNPSARSPVGALGLMQVMPATGRTLARQLGIRGFEPEMLTKPELNVMFGMAYLADQLRAWNGRLDAVLSAYNAGPARISRWSAFPEYRDRTLFAERIPYDETRDYVRIVQNNRRLYAALYGSGSDEDVTSDRE